MVPLTAWIECQSGYAAAGGYLLRKVGRFWIATREGKELLRDEYLCNVMMRLCK